MVNAARVLSAFVMALPQHRTPETTEGREGFLHPISIAGNASEAKAQFLVRSFTEEGLQELEDVLRDTAAFMQKRYPGAIVAVEIKTSYRNMKYKLDAEPRAEAYAEEAIRRAGLTPEKFPVRGGTDGSRLSFMGLPTPNLFNGSMNFHGKKEWVPLEWMEKSAETVVNLMEVWVERSGSKG
jgi:tripeptide aminopeptidase